MLIFIAIFVYLAASSEATWSPFAPCRKACRSAPRR